MPSGHHLSILVDAELQALVGHRAEQQGISASAVVRTALREFFAVVDGPYDAGFREGYAAAYSAVQKTVQRAIAEIQPFAPSQLR